MKKIIPINILLLFALLTIDGRVLGAVSWGPYLQNLKDHSVDICFGSLDTSAAEVFYGLDKDLKNSIIPSAISFSDSDGSTRYQFCATLSDLKKGRTYYYRVMAGGEETEIKSFYSKAEVGSPFYFVVLGDTRTNRQYHRQVIEQMLHYQFDFYLNTGDIVEDGWDITQWDTFFEVEADLFDHIHFFPAIGNHDVRDSEDNVFQGREVYSILFSLPDESSGTEMYYYFDYGNSRFVALSTEEDFTTESDQYIWACQVLQEASSQEDIRHIFVFYHRPAYSSGWTGGDDGKPVSEYLVPLVKQFDVKIVFNGHEHCYERSLVEGIYYITTGGGGAPPSFVKAHENPYSQVFDPNSEMDRFHFVLVYVNGDYIKTEAITMSGEMIDWLEIGEPPLEDNGCGGCSSLNIAGEKPYFEPVIILLLVVIFILLNYGKESRIRRFKDSSESKSSNRII